MIHVNKDRTRIATLWLKNEMFLDIPEDMWPSSTHGDDHTAATEWSKITGLSVTIKTETLTTVDLRFSK
jgi:hypothetical protein